MTVVKVVGGYLEVEGGGILGGGGGSRPIDPSYGQGTPPGQVWGGAGQPYPPGSGQPGGPGWTPHPEHPIPPGYWGGAPGQPGQPPGFWGGITPHPDHGLPGNQPSAGWPPVIMPPIYYPGAPGKPPGVIAGGPGSLPPWVMPPIAPGGGGGGEGIWGGKPPEWVDNTLPPDQPVAGWPPTIMPPIFYPPDVPPVDPPDENEVVEWHTGWTPDKGWVVVGIVTPEAPHPTPSQQSAPKK